MHSEAPELQDSFKSTAINTAMGTAIVIGASGGLGLALTQCLAANAALQSPNQTSYDRVLSFSRKPNTSQSTSLAPSLDYADEATVAQSAAWAATQCQDAPIKLLVVATGYLHSDGAGPERSLQQLDAAYLQQVMLVNAIGPVLVLKHFAPLLPKTGETRIAFISAKVGSIGDNALGGWYGYRAAKAALNQIVKTASIELKRHNKQSICVALHPGTVTTPLSAPFNKSGLNVRSPQVAAQELLSVIHGLKPSNSGGFYDYKGESIVW
jgi:NAD(P)-dependent dehydrogenase (short-subunit alcohol dehydrogenase family)